MPIYSPYFHIFRGGHHHHVLDLFTELRKTPEGRTHISALHLLWKDLQTLFEYIEPTQANLGAYSHRTFELLMRCAMEVESNFKVIFEKNGHPLDSANIKRYSDLDPLMKLSEYSVELPGFSLEKSTPFINFAEPNRDYRSPKWYISYNNSKHNRISNFKEANFEAVIDAMSGLFVLVCAQYGNNFNVSVIDKNKPTTQPTMFNIVKWPEWSPDELYDSAGTKPEWAQADIPVREHNPRKRSYGSWPSDPWERVVIVQKCCVGVDAPSSVEIANKCEADETEIKKIMDGLVALGVISGGVS